MFSIFSRLFAWLISSEVVGSVVKSVLKVLAGVGIFAAASVSIPAFFNVSYLQNMFVELLQATPFFMAIYYAMDLMQVNYGFSVVISAMITGFAISKISNKF